MANSTQGLLKMVHRESGEIKTFHTINFSNVPGSSYLIVIEKPTRETQRVVDREGGNVDISITYPPLQRLINMDEYENIVFMSDDHMEQQNIQMLEACEKANVDPDSLLALVRNTQGSNSH